jgi:AraC-like DNA-binding protein
MDRPMVRHTHRESHLVFHVAGPAEWLSTPNGAHPLSPEFGVAVNPWEPHSYDMRRPSPGTTTLVIYINPSWFETRRAASGGPLYFGRTSIAVDDRLEPLKRQLVELLLEGGERPELGRILFDFTDACFQATITATPQMPASARRRVSDFRIRKSLRLLSSFVDTDPDLRFVAAESGLSRPQFFKLFNDQVGVPPKLFWNTLRMERALSAVTETMRPITQIGLELGFASTSSFFRFFASNVGLAPADYRRAVRILSG